MALKSTPYLVPSSTVCSLNYLLKHQYSPDHIARAGTQQEADELQAKRDWILALRSDLRKRK